MALRPRHESSYSCIESDVIIHEIYGRVNHALPGAFYFWGGVVVASVDHNSDGV